MKKYFFTLLVALATFSACAQKGAEKETQEISKPGFNFTIKIKDFGANIPIILGNYMGDKHYVRDTAFTNNSGEAIFKGDTSLERGIYFILLPNMTYFEVVISNNNHFYIETDTTSGDYYAKMVVKGSYENQKYLEYNKFIVERGTKRAEVDAQMKELAAANKQNTPEWDKLKSQAQALDLELRNYKKEYIQKYPKHLLANILNMMEDVDIPEAPAEVAESEKRNWQYNYYKTHYWDNVNFNETGLSRSPGGILQKVTDRFFDKVISQEPDSISLYADKVIGLSAGNKELERYFIWYLTLKYETSKVMCHDAVFVHMAKEYYCKGRAFWTDTSVINSICKKAEKLSYTLCNAKAPDLRMADTKEKYHNLYDIKTPFTILFFWDPTCGHCKKVIPILNELSKKYKDTISVYAVGAESKFEEWEKYIQSHPEINHWKNVNKTDRYWPWPINKQNYDIIANPVIFLLDKDKNILAKKIDENKLEEFIVFMMGNKGLLSSEEADRRILEVRAKAKPESEEEH